MNSYNYKIKKHDNPEETILTVINSDGIIDYEVFNYLAGYFRDLNVVTERPLSKFKFIDLSEEDVLAELVKLGKERQDEIVPIIKVPNRSNALPYQYLDMMWFFLYYGNKEIELSAENADELVTSLVEQDNPVLYNDFEYHPLELALRLENLSSDNYNDILYHLCNSSEYFMRKHSAGIMKRKGWFDWRTIILESKLPFISENDKSAILQQFFLNDEITKTKELYAAFIRDACQRLHLFDCISEDGNLVNDNPEFEATLVNTGDLELVEKLAMYRVFCQEQARRHQKRQ